MEEIWQMNKKNIEVFTLHKIVTFDMAEEKDILLDSKLLLQAFLIVCYLPQS